MDIRVQHLSFRYESSPDWVLRDVSFQVRQGEFVLVIGEGGSGKSTLLYCLNGLIPHVISGTLEGSIEVGGKTLDRVAMSTIARSIGFIFQNSESQLFTTTAVEEVALGLEEIAIPRVEMEKRVEKALEIAGLTQYREAPLYSLSGGQKQILALVSILSMEPEVLLLDEPTGDLDPIFTHQVYRVLQRANQARATVILVDHKIETILETFGPEFRVIALKRGSVSVDCNARQILSDTSRMEELGIQVPAVVETAALLAAAGYPVGQPLTVSEGAEAITKLLEPENG
jgi:energy-coupling factor transporter ATP-binding protein EcfA2